MAPTSSSSSLHSHAGPGPRMGPTRARGRPVKASVLHRSRKHGRTRRQPLPRVLPGKEHGAGPHLGPQTRTRRTCRPAALLKHPIEPCLATASVAGLHHAGGARAMSLSCLSRAGIARHWAQRSSRASAPRPARWRRTRSRLRRHRRPARIPRRPPGLRRPRPRR